MILCTIGFVYFAAWMTICYHLVVAVAFALRKNGIRGCFAFALVCCTERELIGFAELKKSVPNVVVSNGKVHLHASHWPGLDSDRSNKKLPITNYRKNFTVCTFFLLQTYHTFGRTTFGSTRYGFHTHTAEQLLPLQWCAIMQYNNFTNFALPGTRSIQCYKVKPFKSLQFYNLCVSVLFTAGRFLAR